MKDFEVVSRKPKNSFFSHGFILSAVFILIGSLLILLSNYSVYAAENVFVLIIDGLRNDEAFDDPTHQYIPHMWNDLRPLGTINTNFWNTGITVTTAAHNQIVTGVRAFLSIQGGDTSKLHSKYPNIFEYYRKQKNIPKEKVWFIAGKGPILKSLHYSLHPDYAHWGASGESFNRSDADTWVSVQQKMDTFHPSLVVINLRDVDHTGHKGIYTDYAEAIKKADQIVYDLWQKIQSDAFYKDKTDFIITTDHGRHSDGFFNGYIDHGARNHGNRHILFLAIGPDFKQNEIIDLRRDHIDIGPTIGAILGVQTPYADGEVMTELFHDPTLGQDIVIGGQRRVSISGSGSGLHVVWSQKHGQEWDIYYKKSQDGGNTWTEPVTLFKNGENDNYFYESKVTSQDNMVYIVVTGYSLINEGGDTFTWKIFGRRSLDGGDTWENVQELRDVGLFADQPAIVSNKNNILITYSSDRGRDQLFPMNHSLRGLYSINQGSTFADYMITDKEKDSSPIGSGIAIDQNRLYVVWTSERAGVGGKYFKKYWNVFFDKSSADPMAWKADKIITSNTKERDTFFLGNSIAANNSGAIKILSTKRNDTRVNEEYIVGKWQTIILSSNDYGNTFASGCNFYDSTNYEAWNPRTSFINPATRDFIVVWEQHQNGNGAEIYERRKVSGIWKSVFPISSIDSRNSAEPDLAIYNGNIYVGWQDYETGNWQIKVQKIN
jgi:hypothetical protein